MMQESLVLLNISLGDGLDERDQHLSYSVNTLSCDEWDKTFGMVYQSLIDAGIEAIDRSYYAF